MARRLQYQPAHLLLAMVTHRVYTVEDYRIASHRTASYRMMIGGCTEERSRQGNPLLASSIADAPESILLHRIASYRMRSIHVRKGC
jgi:hypothetical protein